MVEGAGNGTEPFSNEHADGVDGLVWLELILPAGFLCVNYGAIDCSKNSLNAAVFEDGGRLGSLTYYPLKEAWLVNV